MRNLGRRTRCLVLGMSGNKNCGEGEGALDIEKDLADYMSDNEAATALAVACAPRKVTFFLFSRCN